MPTTSTPTAKLHDLQTWDALPTGSEDRTPAFASAAAETIPLTALDGVTIRLAAGNSWGLTSSVDGSSPLVLAEFHLADNASVALDDARPERAVLSIDGDIRVGGTAVPAGHLAVQALVRGLRAG